MMEPTKDLRKTKKPRISTSKRSGLIFPASRVRRYLRKGNYAKYITRWSSIYLSSVLEYMCAEVAEVSGIMTKADNKRRITPRHIQLAIKGDDELNQLLNRVTIPEGGVVPKFAKRKTKKEKSKVNHLSQTESATSNKTWLAIEQKQDDQNSNNNFSLQTENAIIEGSTIADQDDFHQREGINNGIEEVGGTIDFFNANTESWGTESNMSNEDDW